MSRFVPHQVLSVFISSSHCVPTIVPITFACTGILIVFHYLFPHQVLRVFIKFPMCSHHCSHNLCLHWNSCCISLFVPPIKFSVCSHQVPNVLPLCSQCVPITFARECVCKIFRTYLFYLLIFNKLIKCILFGTRCQNWQYLVEQMFLFLAKSPRLVTKRKGSANQDSSGKNWPSQSLMLF